MRAEFKLPDLGEGLTESEILSWHVAVGESVELNQILGEVETAKAVVELPSPYAGTVTAITHEPGTTVDVGEVIIAFDVPDPGRDRLEGAPPAAEPAQRVPTLVGYGADPEPAGRPVRRARRKAADESAAPGPAPAAPVAAAQVRPLSTPPVRKLAHDLLIDLAKVHGTGERGLITRADVQAYAAGNRAEPPHPAAEAPASSMHGAREERLPIKGVRKMMAQAMVQSAFTAPHVTEFLSVDVTRGMKFLSRLGRQPQFEHIKLTPLTLAARAVVIALAEVPELGTHWDEAAQEIVRRNYVNLGIAAATPRGLLVPNIKDAQGMGLRDLALALADLRQTARDGKTQPADLAHGTFSITNIGVFGIDSGTPILNPGEAGILALGAVRRQPWEHKGKVALRSVTTLSLSFDHRLVDGAAGSKFLARVGAVMADPAVALL